jgi:hypothetical protein
VASIPVHDGGSNRQLARRVALWSAAVLAAGSLTAVVLLS